MLEAVTSAISSVIAWIGTVVDALVGTAGASGAAATSGALSALLPMFAIGIAISAFLLGVKAVRSIVWGA